MPDNVEFETFSPTVFRDVVRRGLGAPIEGRGELHLPEVAGDGLVPGVVVVEGLGGLKDSRERAYGRFLQEHGFAVLLVDSFGSRNAEWMADDVRAIMVTEAMMCADAYAGLRFLQQHPRVDPDRICVIGFSYGGMITVLTAHEQVRRMFATGEERFACHAAYYGCSVARLEDPAATGAPVLIVLGENDRNVSIDRTRAIAEDLRRGGAEVELRILADTFHQWDGDDIDKRHVRFNLRHVNARLTRDGTLKDEATGLPIAGRLSRALLLMSRVSPAGYTIQRSQQAIEESNTLLLSFLRETICPGTHRNTAQSPQPPGSPTV